MQYCYLGYLKFLRLDNQSFNFFNKITFDYILGQYVFSLTSFKFILSSSKKEYLLYIPLLNPSFSHGIYRDKFNISIKNKHLFKS